MEKKKHCRYFPLHPFVGAAICQGHVQDGRVVIKQCEHVVTCLCKLYADNPVVAEKRLRRARAIRKKIEKINEVKDVQ